VCLYCRLAEARARLRRIPREEIVKRLAVHSAGERRGNRVEDERFDRVEVGLGSRYGESERRHLGCYNGDYNKLTPSLTIAPTSPEE